MPTPQQGPACIAGGPEQLLTSGAGTIGAMSPRTDQVIRARAESTVRDWLRDSDILAGKSELIPAGKRLGAKLTAVVTRFVDPWLADFEAEAVELLRAAHAPMRADMDAATADLEPFLDRLAAGYGLARTEMIASGDLQDRVAAALRDRWLAAWALSFDAAGNRIAPIPRAWLEPNLALQGALSEYAKLHRCRRWAAAVGAADVDSFPKVWGPPIRQRIAATHKQRDPEQPQAAGLGELAIPDLVNGPDDAQDWRAATDRSFLNRIRLYWDTNHVPEDFTGRPSARRPDKRFEDLLDPGTALVRESIERTISPLGLTDPWHRGLAESLAGDVAHGTMQPAHGNQAGFARQITKTWVAGPTSAAGLAEVSAAVLGFTAARLNRAETASGAVDAHELGKFVARRMWVRMHAWEVVGATIPANQLVRSLRTSLEQGLRTEAITRPRAGVTPNERRMHMTLALITEACEQITAEGRELTADSIGHRYHQLWSTRSKQPETKARGGLHTPKFVHRLLASTGVQR